ncbi:hypothetical protein ACAG24_008260 [Mycobacterium sp. pW049]|uniref:hypothetical protein n=1 Tax=[Mycobacterium] bulgaricum TaxID=3238985 RepID=UPI00351AEBDE
MDISARSLLTVGVSLSAASAIALAPVAANPSALTVTKPDAPPAVVSDVRLSAVSDEIEVGIANLQAFLDAAAVTVADVVGLPGRDLIGVAGGIETLFDVALTGWIDAMSDPTAAASLSIVRTLAVDAWAKLEENLGLGNAVITEATEQVGRLISGAFTGSGRNLLIAGANVLTTPLSVPAYAGVLSAGLASGQLVIGNGLRVIQTVGGAAFDVAGIAVRELTFQLTNLLGGASALFTQLGESSDSPLIEAVLGAVRDLALAPVRAVVNLGSGVIQTVLMTANAGFDVVLDVAINAVDPVDSEPSEMGDRGAAVPVATLSAPEEDPAKGDIPEEDIPDEDTPVAEASEQELAAEEATEKSEEDSAEESVEQIEREAPTRNEPTDDDTAGAEPEDGHDHRSKSGT